MSIKHTTERADRVVSHVKWTGAEREAVTYRLVHHYRVNPPAGDCSCGHVVPPGHSFATHQADEALNAMLDLVAAREAQAAARVRATPSCVDGCGQDAATIARLREKLEQLAKVEADLAAGEASDGYHTHRELYDYRMLYNAHAARGWVASGIPVVKSWRHDDGEECFGGGWFIVTATLSTGQVSNHYKAEYWDLFAVPEVDLPPEYDGHTPQDAADRLRAALESES